MKNYTEDELFDMSVYDLIDIIEELKQNQIEWHSVDEITPEDLVEYTDRKAISVLVCTKRGTIHSCNRQCKYIYKYDGTKSPVLNWYWGRITDVTHWAKLPNKPKE